MKIKMESRELEEKLREALATAQHRGDVIKQLRDEVKQANSMVRLLLSL